MRGLILRRPWGKKCNGTTERPYKPCLGGKFATCCHPTWQEKPYDFCALVPVVEGAGGVMTDWQGQSLTVNSDGRVVAAGDGAVHGLALGALGMMDASRQRA